MILQPPPGQRVRTISLQVETLPTGALRVSSPLARGWAGVARTPHELARVMADAFTEVSVASYARAHGEAYDLDALTGSVPGDSLAGGAAPRVRRAQGGRKAYHPGLWTKLPNGWWRSPGGRDYGPDTKIVRDVIRRRTDLGLPC